MLPLQDELIQVSQALKATGTQYVFVGGAIAPMLITDDYGSCNSTHSGDDLSALFA